MLKVMENAPTSGKSKSGKLHSQDTTFARLDLERLQRTGIAEAVYAPGKTPSQCVEIIAEMLQRVSTRTRASAKTRTSTENSALAKNGPVLLSRPDDAQATAVLEAFPDAQVRERLIFWRGDPVTSTAATSATKIAILTAGTGDLPPAQECAGVLEAYGIESELICDVGVAGIHRTLEASKQLCDVVAVVVVAGMEGALASVVGGLTPAPVVAVPSSVGYGSSLEGVTALLAMLSSCSPGITVVGIDNGFGAACAVLRILNSQKF